VSISFLLKKGKRHRGKKVSVSILKREADEKKSLEGKKRCIYTGEKVVLRSRKKLGFHPLRGNGKRGGEKPALIIGLGDN